MYPSQSELTSCALTLSRNKTLYKKHEEDLGPITAKSSSIAYRFPKRSEKIHEVTVHRCVQFFVRERRQDGYRKGFYIGFNTTVQSIRMYVRLAQV